MCLVVHKYIFSSFLFPPLLFSASPYTDSIISVACKCFECICNRISQISLPVFCTPSYPCNPETFNSQSFPDIQFPALLYFSCATHFSHAYCHSNFSTNSGPCFLSSAIQNTRININVSCFCCICTCIKRILAPE